MSESLHPAPDEPALVVPPDIEAVVADYNTRTDAYTVMDIYSALCTARQALENPTRSENSGAWAEVLAFGLTGTEHNEKPWGTYFGPIGSGTRENGETVYFPDVKQADAVILTHWKERARSAAAPVLVARYNDLVWDMSKLIAGERREVEFARRAIDAYLGAVRQNGRDAHDAFPDAERALALSIQIDDQTRRDAARAALLNLHKQAVLENTMWWRAYDALDAQPKSGLTQAERDDLVADLESVLLRCSDTSDSTKFNPHDVESAANKLVTHYRRVDKKDEIIRLHLAVAKTFEHFGSMADAMLASTVLQTSMDAYRQAGMPADAERILRLIEKSNVESIAQMTRHEHRQEIPAEVVEQFLAHVIADTKEETFHRLACEFLTIRAKMEEALKESEKSSPLATIIPRTKLKGDRVVAHIGSLWEDPIGHLIDETNMYLALTTPWLGWAMDRAKERHALEASDFEGWANRTGLFGDGVLLREGIAAWMAADYLKAAHMLVPQVEAGFRALVGRCGRPTTKSHPQMPQARMVITMGEILFNEETAPALGTHGPDIVLHFRTLYADPRGHNLRNDLAHGLASPGSLHAGIMLWVVQSLLLLGAWLKPDSRSHVETPSDGSER
jgi:hypothetical protein